MGLALLFWRKHMLRAFIPLLLGQDELFVELGWIVTIDDITSVA